jgi:2-oxoglutarate ferredoxin oxidoreductase subunit alpha
MAPALARVGGTLLQAEDELASVNMIIGASYGGVPSLTATAGPGLALMTEGIGLAVAAEVPIVVVDVMRGGPSTGIPAKSEQSDLSFAVDGLHGDAPRLVLAPTSIADCLAHHANGRCIWPRRCRRPRWCCRTSSWASRAR